MDILPGGGFVPLLTRFLFGGGRDSEVSAEQLDLAFRDAENAAASGTLTLDQRSALSQQLREIRDKAAGQDDSMLSCAWIDLPDKHGLLYFGQLVTTPVGYTAPGDPDGFVHMWYGDPYHTGG